MNKKFKVIKKDIPVEAYQTTKLLKINTLEGIMIAQKGDWIIKGINGEKYPVKKSIFEKTYKIISEIQ